MMYFTHPPPETSSYGKLRNCRDEIDAIISVLNTLHRSIENQEDEFFHSDCYIVSMIQKDLDFIGKELTEIQNHIIPERMAS